MELNNVNTKSYILVLDSGNGGMFTLNKLRKVLPNENFIFLKDDVNCPYGKKRKNALKKISKKIIDYVIKNYNIKAIVLACNTLSACVFDFLKKQFCNYPILKVEPRLPKIKEKYLILCTNATKKYNKNIKFVKKLKNVYLCSFCDLAKKIDENMQNLSILEPFLMEKLKKYAKLKIDRVVLGCTHYNYIKPQISKSLLQYVNEKQEKKYKIVGKNQVAKYFNNSNFEIKNSSNLPIVLTNKKSRIYFYEGSEKTAKKLKQILTALNLKNRQNEIGKILYFSTSKLEIFK